MSILIALILMHIYAIGKGTPASASIKAFFYEMGALLLVFFWVWGIDCLNSWKLSSFLEIPIGFVFTVICLIVLLLIFTAWINIGWGKEKEEKDEDVEDEEE